MKDKKKLIVLIIIAIVLLSLILHFIVISISEKNQEGGSKSALSVSLLNTEVQDEKDYENRIGSRDIDFVDEETIKIIKNAYSKIDFLGKFEKGDKEVYDFYKRQYLRLLKREVTFFDKQTQNEYYINEFNEMNYTNDSPQLIYGGELSSVYGPHNYMYYFFDMDCDGMPELGVTNEERFVYIMKYISESDSFILWYEIPPSWTRLLGSRKLSFGGGTSPIRYAYCSLDQYGEEEYRVSFYIEGYYNVEKKQDETLYALTLPEFADKNRNIDLSENMKNHAFVDDIQSDRYYFRVTEDKWNYLTQDFFEVRELAEENIKEVRFSYDELFGDF